MRVLNRFTFRWVPETRGRLCAQHKYEQLEQSEQNATNSAATFGPNAALPAGPAQPPLHGDLYVRQRPLKVEVELDLNHFSIQFLNRVGKTNQPQQHMTSLKQSQRTHNEDTLLF